MDKKTKQGTSKHVSYKNYSVLTWMDKSPVYMATNYRKPSLHTKVSRQVGKEKVEKYKCPVLLADYNQNMGGINRFDQMLVYYMADFKCYKGWQRVFVYLLNCCVVNPYISYKMHNPTKSQLEFRLLLVDTLLCTPPPPPSAPCTSHMPVKTR